MIFERLSKSWSRLLGIMRFARIIGLRNLFFLIIVKIFRLRRDISYVRFNGLPVSNFGLQSDESYWKLLNEHLARFKTREDDVFIVSYGKSGHHWSYDFLNMLLHGNLELDNFVKTAFFVEPILAMTGGMKTFDRLPSPRMIFTHLHADALPREVFEKKRKIVRLIRNPKDVAVSAFYHRNLVMKKMRWDDFIEELMDNVEGKRDSNTLFLANDADWFTYELDSESRMNHLDHALVLYYEDLNTRRIWCRN